MSENPAPNPPTSALGAALRDAAFGPDVRGPYAVVAPLLKPWRRPLRHRGFRGLRSWLGPRGWLGFLFIIAAYIGLTIGTVALLIEVHLLPIGLSYALGPAACLPAALALFAPLMSWRIMSVALALIVLAQAGDHSGWPWPVTAMILYGVVLMIVGASAPRQTVIGVGLLSVAIVVVPGVLVFLPPPVFATASGAIAVCLVAGYGVMGRRLVESRLAEQQQLRRQDLATQAVLQERGRIARELHDVVAHHMAVIALQAEAAPVKSPGLPEPTLQTLALIRDSAREALSETRRVIGLLRDEDAAVEREPQPGLDRLDDLVARARDAGMAVTVTSGGPSGPLPLAVDVSAYRIIQEAVSNAARHAPGGPVALRVERTPDVLDLEVVNGKGTRPPERTTNGEPSGHGLIGMRERVEMLGGRIAAGSLADGGYRIHAVLPLQAPTAPDGVELTDDAPNAAAEVETSAAEVETSAAEVEATAEIIRPEGNVHA